MATAAAGVFSGLDSAQLERIVALLGGGADADPLYGRKLGELRRMGLTPEQSRAVMGWLYEMRIGSLNPGLMARMLGGMDVDSSERGALLCVFEKVVHSMNKLRAVPPHAGFHTHAVLARDLTLLDAGARGAAGEPGPARKLPAPPGNEDNVNAFDRFVSSHCDDPEFKDRYVAFVHGKYQKAGSSKGGLVEEMYDRFGAVKMYVGKVTASPRTVLIESPELL